MTDTTADLIARARGTVALCVLRAIDGDPWPQSLVAAALAELPAHVRDYAWASLVLRAAEAGDLRELLQQDMHDAALWNTVQHGDTSDLVAGAEALLVTPPADPADEQTDPEPGR